jgi:DAACS family dicarboxylate/amino acid:cation (Na+ or H+) symporter
MTTSTRSGLRIPLSAQIALAMALGLALGPALGSRAVPFGEGAKVVIQLIKAVAAPLLFLSIVSAILKTEVRLASGVRMVVFAILNGSLAMVIGMALSNWLQPGARLRGFLAEPSGGDAAAWAGKRIDFVKVLVGHVPDSAAKPFVENAVIGIVILAVLLGFALRKVRREREEQGEEGFVAVERALDVGLRATEHVLGWVVKLVPVAVFFVVARTVGEFGYAPFRGLGWYVAVGLLGLVLHVGVVYQLWLVLYARLSLRRFWGAAREPVIYAAGANSSLATLPLTLQALDRVGVSRSASTLGACVGTNLNNDGIILYEGMAVLFVAQASGLDLTLAEQIAAAGICMVAAMGVAGVPEAGFISLALVLNTLDLPIEVLPLLLSVDWVLARARSVTNVLSDMVLSILIDGPSRWLGAGDAAGSSCEP